MKRRISQRDEFLLSRLLDDDLPPDESASLRRRLAQEPALREAFESMACVSGLLESRRADRPDVDWQHFHEEVMATVRAETTAPPASRLLRWVRIGVPLAAAAGLVLLVSVGPFAFRSPGTSGTPVGPHGGQARAGELIVQIQRPALPGPPAESALELRVARSARPKPDDRRTDHEDVIQVSFLQSEVLQKAIEKEDTTSRKRTGIVMATASSSLTNEAAEDFMGEPPL